MLDELTAKDKPAEIMVQWIKDSKARPPVRAITSVIKASGEVDSKVPITDETRAGDVLRVRENESCLLLYHALNAAPFSTPTNQYTKSAPGCDLFECGGNINRRRLPEEALILPVLKVNPGLTLMVMALKPGFFT